MKGWFVLATKVYGLVSRANVSGCTTCATGIVTQLVPSYVPSNVTAPAVMVVVWSSWMMTHGLPIGAPIVAVPVMYWTELSATGKVAPVVTLHPREICRLPAESFWRATDWPVVRDGCVAWYTLSVARAF